MDLLIAVPLVIAITEAIKRAGKVDSRFVPALSIVVGVSLFALFEGVSTVNLFQGLLSGLTASGLYSGAKATVGE